MPRFKTGEFPFSSYGSYFSILTESGDLKILDLHGGDRVKQEIYSLPLQEGKLEMSPTLLKIEKGNGFAEIVFDSKGDLWLYISNMELELYAQNEKYNTLLELKDNYFEHIMYAKERRIGIYCVEGKMQVQQKWTGVESENIIIKLGGIGDSLIKIMSFLTVAPELPEVEKSIAYFQQLKTEQALRYQQWHSALWQDIHWQSDEENEPATIYCAEVAIYLLWSNMVFAQGQLPYDSNYCSKSYMNNSWSWDFCFVAIALAKRFPELSFNQFKVFVENQGNEGCYPDFINDQYKSYSCTKPPIQAWMYQKLIDQNEYFSNPERLSYAYLSLKKMVNYWLMYRRNEQGLIYYYHGNDSGWDNSSLFLSAPPIQTPDLTSYLIREIGILKDFAQRLNNGEEDLWQEIEEKLFQILLEQLNNGRLFYARDYKKQQVIQADKPLSLALFLPLVLGKKLPIAIREAMLKELKERFLCPYGLSTEAFDSPYYKKAGYWLGPVWAPVMYLFIDALNQMDEENWAIDLENRFLELTKIGLMAENFDPFTGEGFDDKGFSWTSAVYYQLLKENKDRKAKR